MTKIIAFWYKNLKCKKDSQYCVLINHQNKQDKSMLERLGAVIFNEKISLKDHIIHCQSMGIICSCDNCKELQKVFRAENV